MLLKTYGQGLQAKQIDHIVECLRHGGIIIYPTDTVYGMGTGLSNIKSINRLAQIKYKRKEDLNYTIICHDLSRLSHYTAPISNPLFRFIKTHIPGPFTFILNANNEIPKIFQSKKKTIGIRVPDNPIVRQIVEALGEPLLNTSIDAPEDETEYITDPEAIHQRYGKWVDLVIDGGMGNVGYSTVVDCTQEEISIIRQGIGEL
ncbi:MAG: threonylcarbamoyl-AMP synthase [Bacteroidetes bacterium]|uniref:Threonylcarbamoyl-AMP synthase n=1 Tax=Candidatus Pullibacteroides excrementavium TaxID=2840905 RepID=A0A9D9DWC4_9BACT|nr:threonylcarbamoyl-AMP synthase [Candidatus Pullibacteroides excrementavium]